ncbi:hypothetical protein ACAG24_013530 [Mycobacterium sp. pW049]|uniref:hypothetical protein n=1 Tax=[Mycobacterium] bulgaricum TaxID=3238985 RepID=UPI00351B508B
MSYQLKITLYATTMFIVVAGGVLLTWAYLEVQHADEKRQLIECIRAESHDNGKLPLAQVVDGSIQRCEGEQWLVR